MSAEMMWCPERQMYVPEQPVQQQPQQQQQQPLPLPQPQQQPQQLSVNDPYLSAPLPHGSFSISESFSSCEGIPSVPPSPPPMASFSGASSPAPHLLDPMPLVRVGGSFRYDPYGNDQAFQAHSQPPSQAPTPPPQTQLLQLQPPSPSPQPPLPYQCINDACFQDLSAVHSNDFPTRTSMESTASSLSNSGNSAMPMLVETHSVPTATIQPVQPMQPAPLSIDGLSNGAMTPPPGCPSPSASSHGGHSNGLSASSSCTPNTTPTTKSLQVPVGHSPAKRHHQSHAKKDKRNVLVEYKHGRKGVCTLPHGAISRECETDPEGYIVVEGDRGIDICRIISLTVRKSADAPGLKHPMVLREAKPEEVEYWAHTLADQESTAVKVVNDLITRAKLPLAVTHAAYQLDKKKLTFIYESPQHQPDFRCLLSECYAVWKCRIWFTCLPKKVAKPNTITA